LEYAVKPDDCPGQPLIWIFQDVSHQHDRACRRGVRPIADDLKLVYPIADDLNYFVDAMSCLRTVCHLMGEQMMAFHLKNVLMLTLRWMVEMMDVPL
jgi:hypothetical protein